MRVLLSRDLIVCCVWGDGGGTMRLHSHLIPVLHSKNTSSVYPPKCRTRGAKRRSCVHQPRPNQEVVSLGILKILL